MGVMVEGGQKTKLLEEKGQRMDDQVWEKLSMKVSKAPKVISGEILEKLTVNQEQKSLKNEDIWYRDQQIAIMRGQYWGIEVYDMKLKLSGRMFSKSH